MEVEVGSAQCLDVLMQRYQTDGWEVAAAEAAALQARANPAQGGCREDGRNTLAGRRAGEPESMTELMVVEQAEAVAWSQDLASNKFVEHKVTPADTLGGLELRYGISASEIMRVNGMTSDRLNSYFTLQIPNRGSHRPTNLKPTVVADQKLDRLRIDRVFRMAFPEVSEKEVDFYLKECNGSVQEALRLCDEDLEWERKNGKLLKWRSSHSSDSSKRKRGLKAWLPGWLVRRQSNQQDRPIEWTLSTGGPAAPTRIKMDDRSPAERATSSIEKDYANEALSPLLTVDYLEAEARALAQT